MLKGVLSRLTGRIAALSLLWKLPNAGLWILSVFRSGVAFERGNGKVFYFRPGHETYPIYFDKNVLKVIGNAVIPQTPGKGFHFTSPASCGCVMRFAI